MRLETGEEVFTCLHCGNKTSHKNLGLHEQEVHLGVFIPNTIEEITASNYVHFFECSTCKGITIKEIFSEEIDDFSEVNYEKMKTLYPQVKNFSDDMPRSIVKSYGEAMKVKNISQEAFAILIRKCLDAMCADQKAIGGSLRDKIKDLVKKEILPGTLAEMVDTLRLLGNIGAHDYEAKFTKEQIETIDYFFTAVVEYVYIAPNKLKKLKLSVTSNNKKS